MDDHSALAIKARQDEKAFAELYNLYLGPIYAFVLKRLGHIQTSEDIVADIFQKVFLHLHDFNPEKASFKTWIYRISVNTIIDHFRTNHNTSSLEENFTEISETTASSSPHDDYLSAEKKEEIQKIIQKLPIKYQRVISLRYFAELEITEIAKILGVSPNHASVLIHRGLKKLTPIVLNTTTYVPTKKM